MNNERLFDYQPDILGMQWNPGDLVLVAGPVVARSIYINGNIIAKGTGTQIPVGLFSPGGDPGWRMDRIMRIRASSMASNESGDRIALPLYIDDSQHMTISYLVSRIFHMTESNGVRMVIVHPLHSIDGSIFDNQSKEVEMNGILRVLKAIAVSLKIMIVVSTKLSERCLGKDSLPTTDDILYVTEAEKHSDQIILIHHVKILENGVQCYKFVIPVTQYEGTYSGGLVINTITDNAGYCFKKATTAFKVVENRVMEQPMYRWIKQDFGNYWKFSFLDSSFMRWDLLLESIPLEADSRQGRISLCSWAGETNVLEEDAYCDDISFMKHKALELARRHFPDVDIQEKA